MKKHCFSRGPMVLFYFVVQFLLFSPLFSRAQDFMMQGWYWDYPKTVNGYNWADTMQARATSIAKGGFTYVWLPPLPRTSSGQWSNGYDPKDLYDLGGYGLGPTGFGSSTDVANVIQTFNKNNIKTIADVVYNHRDGGLAENNPVVQDYVNNAHSSVCSTNPLYNDPSFSPYPSDRFRYILPIGGATGNGAGDYYIKIASISGNSNYYGFPYTFYAQTNAVGYQNQPATTQTRPDGGGNCGQPNMAAPLGVNINATIANQTGGACGTDEYHITLTNSDFNAAGDTLFIYIANQNGQYSDHRIYGLYSGSLGTDIANQLVLQTYTDFTRVASGQGLMNYTYFHPNGTNCSVLGKDWDYPYFYYDYDQSAGSNTESALIDWTKWLWNSVGVRGLRMDAVKEFNPQFVGDLLTSLNSSGINPGFVVGEFFDYNVGNVNNWIQTTQSYMSGAAKSAIHVRAFDFPLREALQNALDAYGTDVRSIYSAGIAHNGGSAFNAVTFVNNHDLRDPGQPVQHNPLLAYAYLFTDNSIGLPSVFYPDYFGISLPNYPAVYLKPAIDSLIALHKAYIYGSPTVQYLNYNGSSYENTPTSYGSAPDGASTSTSLIYQISGGTSGKDVIVGINFAGTTLKVDHQIDTHNGSIAPNTNFYDKLNRSNYPYAVVSNNNTIYMELPPFSYSVWVNDPTPLVLPIRLLSFTGRLVDNTTVLKWETGTEINNQGFYIEKSLDGKSWSTIGFVKSKALNGSSATSIDYDFTDNRLHDGTNYYRLKQVDLDGKALLSGVVTVAFSTGSVLKLYPNPASSYIDVESSYVGAQICVTSADGKILKTQTISGTIERVDVSRLVEGFYLLQLRKNGKIIKSEKFFKGR